ncbi:hypothetical protein Pcinc_023784 [Petrolisthes cinctipes]|uniref:Regulatory protein zeste n=1 Tax=Petrolisthes cinctipes TaxID=88211 RepID=A0AAE1FB59_PETCI|nr:hypothetical protein Pcinc_023784 [Petrolisthes cinctipes]
MDRTAPLSQTQRMALLNLIKERDSIVNNKSTAPGIIEAKKRTWEEIVLKFNALNPDQQPRSSKQLKRSYDHVKRNYASVERVFSTAGDVLRARRSSLDEVNFEKLVLLKENIDLLEEKMSQEDMEEEEEEDDL